MRRCQSGLLFRFRRVELELDIVGIAKGDQHSYRMLKFLYTRVSDSKFVKAFGPFINILDLGNDELEVIQSHIALAKFGGALNFVLD
jgi:hypothetical protein